MPEPVVLQRIMPDSMEVHHSLRRHPSVKTPRGGRGSCLSVRKMSGTQSQSSDYQQLMVLHEEEVSYLSPEISAVTTLEDRCEWVLRMASSPHAKWWGVYDQTTMVGYLIAHWQPWYVHHTQVCVDAIYVRRGYPTQTVMRSLRDALELWAHTLGAVMIHGGTLAAPKHWQRMGYALGGYLMVKWLPRERA